MVGKRRVPRKGPHWPIRFMRTRAPPRPESEPWLSAFGVDSCQCLIDLIEGVFGWTGGRMGLTDGPGENVGDGRKHAGRC